jgi:hypothetical protein
LGGGYPLWAFFSHNIGAMLSDRKGMWFENICESSSFVFGFVPLVLMMAFSCLSKNKIKNPWLWFMTFYMIFIGTFTYCGFPVWLSRLTFMGISLPERTMAGFGLANAVVLSATFSSKFDLRNVSQKTVNLALATWAVVLVGSMFWFKSSYPLLRYELSLPFVITNIAAAIIALKLGKMLVLTAFITSLSFITSVKFNPVVIGGTDFLFQNNLSAKMSEISSKDTGKSPWVVMGDWKISNIPKMLGIPSLGGYHNYPDFKIWRQLDPDGRWFNNYNQCAFVTFVASTVEDLSVKNISPGNLQAIINPGCKGLKRLGVRYFLSVGDKSHEVFQKIGSFRELYRFKEYVIYERSE